MTDLGLYRLISKYASEFHSDGIFFIAPWDLKEFVTALGIRDAEEGIECRIVTDGYIALDIANFEGKCDDYEELRAALIADFNEFE